MEKKQCSRCKQMKPLSEFNKCNRAKDGKQSQCKQCKAELQRLYYAKDPERCRANVYRHREKNKDKINARRRELYHQDPHYREYAYKWRRENREKYLADLRQYYRHNAKKRNQWYKEFRKKHPKEASRRWRLYYATHRQERLDKSAYERAQRQNAVTEKFSRQEIYKRDNGYCHICGKKVPKNNFHLDHLIPLSLGGKHTRQNVAIACPKCNLKRGASGPAQLRLFGDI